MINNKEIEQVSLSATKKDFYQIWNELLETAGKLSERWSPESTNESDPGIVLLKVLTAIADKLNYTIDKNTLEAFMPSAAQEESMRKLCDMMGYNMKYYQSATTDVTISYCGSTEIESIPSLQSTGVVIPAYTNIKNADDDINYFTLEQINIDDNINKTRVVTCMEGTVETCGEDTDGIISITQIDDNNRYYLPESQIAENGLFIFNVNDSKASELWTKVENLNTQEVGKQCYKFGFDSKLQMPYVQFPEDISTIIEDGLVIAYTRTNGANGNISYNTLSTLEAPELWSDDTYKDASEVLDIANFAIKNASASTNGRNKESINDAYNTYKKTIGTFDTLVTCRDYMNKIYQLTNDVNDTTPLVSNVIVSDIRDDINKAITLCSFNNYGICYVNKSIKNQIKGTVANISDLTSKTSASGVKVDDIYFVGSEARYYICKTVTETGSTWAICENFSENKISNFDLVLYPFTTISGTVSKTNYINSFRYSSANNVLINQALEENKTISHNIVDPDDTDIACIKVYLRLNAKLTTTTKVNVVEEAAILKNIYAAIYENFNARKIDFGEEIPFDTILAVIQNADTRIKNVSLDDPVLYTKYRLVGDGDDEHDTASYYNKLALRNVLAGRISLFDYNTEFKADCSETKYPSWTSGSETKSYDVIYGPSYDPNTKKLTDYISTVETNFTASARNNALLLNENEVIQFSAPNFKTTKTYPSYVNYFLQLAGGASAGNPAYPATFGTLKDFMAGTGKFIGGGNRWEALANNTTISMVEVTFDTKQKAIDAENKYGAIFQKTSSGVYERKAASTWASATDKYYYFEITADTFYQLDTWISTLNSKQPDPAHAGKFIKLLGLFKSVGSRRTNIPGRMIDANKVKYYYAEFKASTTPLNEYFIQVTSAADDTGETPQYTADGLGRDAEFSGIPANSEYELKHTEFLLINYTPSSSNSTDDTATQTSAEPINETYPAGTIIRPNFDLMSSDKYKNLGHTATKTSGYIFDQQYMQKINDVGGLYTLGTNEQIEVREPVEVILDQQITNIYWERNDENEHTTNDTVTFTWDDDSTGMSYTLKEGEYIYYTDDAKIDLAYYGNGTKITRSTQTINLTKEKTDSTTLANDIANNGLLAALPWKAYNLSSANFLTLSEYQYVNLSTGDTLVSIDKTSPDEGFDITISKTPSKVNSSAIYKLSGTDTNTTLPKIISTQDKYAWRVKSILNLNIGPNTLQTLHSTANTLNSITLKFKTKPDEVLTPKQIGSSTDYTNLSLKANYDQQTSSGKANVLKQQYDDDGKLQNVNDFKVKTLKYSEVLNSKGNKIDIGNYGNGGWTKVSLKDLTNDQGESGNFNLNVMLPVENTHGLIMFYYIENNLTSKDNSAYITISETGKTISICNYDNTNTTLFENGWWKGYKSQDNKYYFRPGINIVEIPSSCTLVIHEEVKTAAHGTLVFGGLDIAKTTIAGTTTYLALNPAIDYKQVEETISIEAQAFSDLKAIDPNYEFYYNAVIDNSIALNLNTVAGEKLSDSRAFYDYNNINNKFVISEIDPEYLSKGIMIASSSKR